MEEVRQNFAVIQKELDALEKEMKTLRQRVEFANLYHNRMEEFHNLKMEYVFMNVELLIYQKRSKKSQAEQWELYKEQVSEIIWEAFESYWKDEKLYQVHLETY